MKPASTPARAWSVYLLRRADGTFYAGSTTDVEARAAARNSGLGAKYTSGRRPVSVVYREACVSRSAALAGEHALKRLTRSAKEALVAGTPGSACPERGRRGDPGLHTNARTPARRG